MADYAPAIDKIIELTRRATTPIEMSWKDQDYVYFPAERKFRRFQQDKDHAFEPLELRSLKSLIDYWQQLSDPTVHDKDQWPAGIIDPREVITHIKSPYCVELMTEPLEHLQMRRAVIARAECDPLRFNFSQPGERGYWYKVEDLLVSLMTQFEDAADRATVIEHLGNIVEDTIVETSDDGAAQVVTRKTGLTTKGKVRIKNPVILTPHRAFVGEIDQPTSYFVIRLRSGSDGVEAALYESASRDWEVRAMEKIEHLFKEVAELPRVLA
jgi:hypothetical protein